MRWLTAILTVVLALGVLAGCGGDDDEPESGGAAAPEATQEPSGGGTTITADPGGDLSWDPTEVSAPAGPVTLTLENESDVPHAIEIEGEASETVTGASTELTVELEAGEYRFICPVGSHAQAGMEGTLTVE